MMNRPMKSTVPDVKHDEPYDPDIAVGTTPPKSPPSLRSPDSSSPSLNPPPGTSALSYIHAALPPASTSTDVVRGSSSSAPPLSDVSSITATPLQTILDTIFGKKKQGSDFAANTTKTTSVPVDPIVQQYRQTSKTAMEFDDTNRPYDPEEEYDTALEYQNILQQNNPTPTKALKLSKPYTLRASDNEVDGDDNRPYDPEEEYNLRSEAAAVHTSNTTRHSNTEPLLGASTVKDDVAYDPEDDTVFEEMQNYLTDNKPGSHEHGTSLTSSLSEQQKMLEDLNRQIEEQKRQLEEQEEALRLQRAAAGVSMAHFSVSDALMSPPPCFGREPDEDIEKAQTTSASIRNRDPRQYRHLGQNTVNQSVIVYTDKENVDEKRKSFKGRANNSLEQDVSINDPDISLGKLDDIRSISTDTTVLSSVRNSEQSMHFSASELQEGTSSPSGNETLQHTHSPSKDLGKTRPSCTSRRQYDGSPQRRSRHETRRSYREKKNSDQSKDEGHRRRGGRTPDRSSRRSRSRSRRKEKPSSRERERHHHRSTSSRRSRSDKQYSSSRSHSTRRKGSPELKNNQANQKEKLASRQKNKPTIELTDSTTSVACEPSQIQSDKSQDEASGSGLLKLTQLQKAGSTKPETEQSHHKERSSSRLPSGTFSQRKQVQLEPNQMKTNTLQKVDFHKNMPQSEKLATQQGRNKESRNVRHDHGNRRGNVLRDNETDFSQGTDEQSPWQESDNFSQNSPKIEREDFPVPGEAYFRNPRRVLPPRPSHLRGNDPEIMPTQNQKSSFSTNNTLHPIDLAPQGAQSVANVDMPQLINNIHENIHSRDQFRPSPQHRVGGPRGRTPMQPRISKTPHHERIDSCRPAGRRGPRMFDNDEPRSFRPRGPSPRMFDETLPHPSGPKGRLPRLGMFEGSGPQDFGPSDAFLSPDMLEGSVTFAGSPQRELDYRDPHLQDFGDSRGYDVPYQVEGEPFLEFGRPRGRRPPHQLHENMLNRRDLEQPNLNDSRHSDPPFDEVQVGYLPFQYSDDARDFGQNVANDSFLNPQEPRGHRNPNSRPMRIRGPAHTRNLPHNQIHTTRSRQSEDVRDQEILRETFEPHLAKADIFEGGRVCERSAPRKGPHFNPLQHLKVPRAPSPHFRDQRMPPSRNTELLEDKQYSSHFSLPSTSKLSRLQVPNADEFPNPVHSRIRLDGPNKEPDVRPLRLSGPLLPTPPGGPIRFHNPRMQRP